MPDVVGLLPGLAQTVVYIAVIIVLAGLVSGIVAVGIMQIFGRAAIQRRVLRRFFQNRRWTRPTAELAGILHMPERLLYRLYYRQITGQLLASASAEAARSPGEGHTPVLDALAPPRPEDGILENETRLNAASRTIDVLQAELGDASATAVSLSLMAVWMLVYLSAGALASESEPAKSFLLLLWRSIGVPVVAVLLAACSSAVGVAVFNWLERISAPR